MLRRFKFWLPKALMRLFRPVAMPPDKQVAALCWRYDANHDVEILTITTRRNRRWCIPKGNHISGLTSSESAAQEAWEEAGVKGHVSSVPLGVYLLKKGGVNSMPEQIVVEVFILATTDFEEEFPESGQRKRTWRSAEKAAKKIREHDLADMIRHFTP